MTVFLNGEFVPEEKAMVSVFDRCFLLGDGLFETVRIHRGKPFRWPQHLKRLQAGADFLKVRMPFAPEAIEGFLFELIQRNQMSESVLRLTLSRGVGPRGYSSRNARQPVLVMSLHPAPDFDWDNPRRWRLITSSFRVSAADPLANFKTCNKLAQVLARAEAEEAGADEALLLNTKGELAEAAAGNVFWIERRVVCTPPLACGALAGVTRELVMKLCLQLDLPILEAPAPRAALVHAEGVFLSLSTFGIVEADRLDQHDLNISPLVERLRRAYRTAVESESGGLGG